MQCKFVPPVVGDVCGYDSSDCGGDTDGAQFSIVNWIIVEAKQVCVREEVSGGWRDLSLIYQGEYVASCC